jgi:hypothetical protein
MCVLLKIRTLLEQQSIREEGTAIGMEMASSGFVLRAALGQRLVQTRTELG